MAGLGLRTLLGPLRKLATTPAGRRTPDQELLERFLGERDEGAFAALMERHVAMVLQVCRRILKNAHDAEDACQAVFLVLARHAHSIRSRDSLASWLHGTARNVAHKLQTSLARRNAREDVVAGRKTTTTEPEDISWREVQRLVDEELNCLPRVYQDALVLCYLEGRTQEAAAQELGWTLGALRGRLERGREMLRARLTRRGVTGAAGLAIAVLLPSVNSAAEPTTLIAGTAAASLSMAAGAPIPASISGPVASLTYEVLRMSLGTKLTIAGIVALCVLMLGWFISPEAVPMQKPPEVREVWMEAGRLDIPNSHIWCVAFAADGKRLAAGARGPLYDSGVLRVWDVDTLQMVFSLATPRSVRCVAFAPDGKTLATAEHDGMARLRDSADGKVLFTLRGHKSQIDTVAYSPDGATLATSGWDGTIRLWNTATGTELRALQGHHGQVFAVNFGRDGTLASGGVDNTAKIWKPANGETLFTLRGHQDVVHWVAFASPDGKTLATASWDKTVRLWNTQTGKCAATLHGHTEPVLAVAFSPHGKALVSSAGKRLIPNSAGELILWDLAAQKARARFHLPDRVYGLAFSPDGKTLAAACWDGTVRMCQGQAAVPFDPTKPPDPQDKIDDLKFVNVQPGDTDALSLKKDYAKEYHAKLKDNEKGVEGLAVYGPEASVCVKFEPTGLRIALPAGYPKPRSGTGVVTDFGLRGDFEITASFDILQEPKAGNAEFNLVIVPSERAEAEVWHKSNQNRASVGREFTAPNIVGQFVANSTKWDPVLPRDKWNNEIFTNIETHTKQRAPTTAKSGRLRLVRNGTTLYFFTSDGPDQEFTLLHKDEFAAKALKNVRMLASTRDPNASLDLRVTDFRIRADAFISPLTTLIPPPAVTAVESPRHGWLLVLLIAMPGLAALIAVGVVAFLMVRRRAVPSADASQADQDAPPADAAEAAPAATISFKCSSCGKSLKAKADKAGNKLKCPKCGVPIVVPHPKELS